MFRGQMKMWREVPGAKRHSLHPVPLQPPWSSAFWVTQHEARKEPGDPTSQPLPLASEERDSQSKG